MTPGKTANRHNGCGNDKRDTNEAMDSAIIDWLIALMPAGGKAAKSDAGGG
ncbi:hypothetical protein [Acinetobacter baumannii]|uniref:hypothetical protein n=1 Tax=Acinetobacter baumannii TaxID=470 RepID=UPI003D2FE2B8